MGPQGHILVCVGVWETKCSFAEEDEGRHSRLERQELGCHQWSRSESGNRNQILGLEVESTSSSLREPGMGGVCARGHGRSQHLGLGSFEVPEQTRFAWNHCSPWLVLWYRVFTVLPLLCFTPSQGSW